MKKPKTKIALICGIALSATLLFPASALACSNDYDNDQQNKAIRTATTKSWFSSADGSWLSKGYENLNILIKSKQKVLVASSGEESAQEASVVDESVPVQPIVEAEAYSNKEQALPAIVEDLDIVEAEKEAPGASSEVLSAPIKPEKYAKSGSVVAQRFIPDTRYLQMLEDGQLFEPTPGQIRLKQLTNDVIPQMDWTSKIKPQLGLKPLVDRTNAISSRTVIKAAHPSLRQMGFGEEAILRQLVVKPDSRQSNFASLHQKIVARDLIATSGQTAIFHPVVVSNLTAAPYSTALPATITPSQYIPVGYQQANLSSIHGGLGISVIGYSNNVAPIGQQMKLADLFAVLGAKQFVGPLVQQATLANLVVPTGGMKHLVGPVVQQATLANHAVISLGAKQLADPFKANSFDNHALASGEAFNHFVFDEDSANWNAKTVLVGGQIVAQEIEKVASVHLLPELPDSFFVPITDKALKGYETGLVNSGSTVVKYFNDKANDAPQRTLPQRTSSETANSDMMLAGSIRLLVKESVRHIEQMKTPDFGKFEWLPLDSGEIRKR